MKDYIVEMEDKWSIVCKIVSTQVAEKPERDTFIIPMELLVSIIYKVDTFKLSDQEFMGKKLKLH